MSRQNAGDLQGHEPSRCHTVMVGVCHYSIHLSKPVERTPPRLSPDVNYRLWVIFVCPFRLINCKRCATVEGGITDGARGYAWVEGGEIWGISVPSC